MSGIKIVSTGISVASSATFLAHGVQERVLTVALHQPHPLLETDIKDFFALTLSIEGIGNVDTCWMRFVDGLLHDTAVPWDQERYLNGHANTTPMVHIPAPHKAEMKPYMPIVREVMNACINQHVGTTNDFKLLCELDNADMIECLKAKANCYLVGDDYVYFPVHEQNLAVQFMQRS